jgi:uncharacterized protein YceK
VVGALPQAPPRGQNNPSNRDRTGIGEPRAHRWACQPSPILDPPSTGSPLASHEISPFANGEISCDAPRRSNNQYRAVHDCEDWLPRAEHSKTNGKPGLPRASPTSVTTPLIKPAISSLLERPPTIDPATTCPTGDRTVITEEMTDLKRIVFTASKCSQVVSGDSVTEGEPTVLSTLTRYRDPIG